MLALNIATGLGYSAPHTDVPPCSGSVEAPWSHAGPAGYYQQDDATKLPSFGAAQAATLIKDTTWLVGVANGGIWKTKDMVAAEPTWKSVTDGQPVTCTSISAMGSQDDTVVAGCGAATSSEMGNTWDVANSGDWAGVMLSTDGGEKWAMTSFPANWYVSGIVVLDASTFFVGARSHLYDQSAGGVWRSTDGGASWTQVFDQPIFDLKLSAAKESPLAEQLLVATVPMAADGDGVYSAKRGQGPASLTAPFQAWSKASTGLAWGGKKPFYPTLALGARHAFVGALTVSPTNLSDTGSSLFSAPLSALGGGGGWAEVQGTPLKLDQDAMPKDRMALLVHPEDESTLFVAGNAGATVYRVDHVAGSWVEMMEEDTADGSAAHVDCRQLYWEASTSSLILLSDGGAFRRTEPAKKGGRWHGAHRPRHRYSVAPAAGPRSRVEFPPEAPGSRPSTSPSPRQAHRTAAGIYIYIYR